MGAKFWLSCLTNLKNCGVTDIFISCVDRLTGLSKAIQTALPQTHVQLVRAALKSVTDADQPRSGSRSPPHRSGGHGGGGRASLEGVWRTLGCKLSDDFQSVDGEMVGHPLDVRPARSDPNRKATYTMNMIEFVDSVSHKFTRSRQQALNRESARKLVYIAIHEASKKWTMPNPEMETSPQPLHHPD